MPVDPSLTKARDARASQGTFVASTLPAALESEGAPAYVGTLSLPGNPERRPFALWVRASPETRQLVLLGTVARDAAEPAGHTPPKPRYPDHAVRVALTTGKDILVEPHTVVLFQGGQDAVSDVTPRPDYSGYFNPGRGEGLAAVAIWKADAGNGKVYLHGVVRAHEPKIERLRPRWGRDRHHDMTR